MNVVSFPTYSAHTQCDRQVMLGYNCFVPTLLSCDLLSMRSCSIVLWRLGLFQECGHLGPMCSDFRSGKFWKALATRIA